ncbi:MAG: hypothetical protein QMC45_05780 [Patiriisocius sp.]|jgi:hypothetical protein|tara:strand:+ start:2254 stop:2802 length:549 start_codon:yes stop_codon:yes gene_type:complete
MDVKITKQFILLTSILLFVSCFDGTDFDQTNEVVLTPEIELDLIYFNLEASNFYDYANNTEVLVVEDTTDLDFLGGSDINDIIKGADFYFEFTNTIARGFNVSFDFLNNDNVSKYLMQTTVSPGSENTPVVSYFVQYLDALQIKELTKANKVLVTVTIPSSSQDLSGVLNLQSKTTYYLQIE